MSNHLSAPPPVSAAAPAGEAAAPAAGPLVLAVDTASPQASYAVVRGGRPLALLVGEAGVPHSRTCFPHLLTLLKLAQVEWPEIDAFAAVVGPGGFTGLRVGLAAVDGLARTLGRVAVGVNALDAWALAAGVAGNFAVVVNAGRGEVYLGLRKVTTAGEVWRLAEDEVGRIAVPAERWAARADLAGLIWVGDAGSHRAEIAQAAAAAGTEVQVVAAIAPGAGDWQLPAAPAALAYAAANYAALILPRGRPAALQACYLRPSDAERKVLKVWNSSK